MAKGKKFTRNDLKVLQTESEFKIAHLATPDHKARRMGFDPLVVEAPSGPIVVRPTVYKGKTRISIRYHYEGQDGLLRPTKRGIELPIEQAHEVVWLVWRILEKMAGPEEADSADSD